MEQFPRISHDIHIMGGKACIKGTRVTVSMLVYQIGEGTTIEELLDNYPYITYEDVMEALKYAAWTASGREIELVMG